MIFVSFEVRTRSAEVAEVVLRRSYGGRAAFEVSDADGELCPEESLGERTAIERRQGNNGSWVSNVQSESIRHFEPFRLSSRVSSTFWRFGIAWPNPLTVYAMYI